LDIRSPQGVPNCDRSFGRQKDFDPHLDSMVRVQAGRCVPMTGITMPLRPRRRDHGEMPKGTRQLSIAAPTERVGIHRCFSRGPNPLQVNAGTRTWTSPSLRSQLFSAPAVAVARDRFRNRRLGGSPARQAITGCAAGSFSTFLEGLSHRTAGETWRLLYAAFVGRPLRRHALYTHAKIPARRSWITIPERASAGRVHLSTRFRKTCISKFASSAAFVLLDDATETTLSSSFGSPSRKLTLLELPKHRNYRQQQHFRDADGHMEILNFHLRIGEPTEFFPPPDETLTGRTIPS